MSDDPVATATPPAPAPQEQAPSTGNEPLGEAGEKALEAFKKRARDAEAKVKELEPLAKRAREAEEADKSELQKAQEESGTLKSENDDLKQQLLKLEVANAKGLPAALIPALTGKDKEAMETNADELLKLVNGDGSSTDFTPGPRTTASEPASMDDRIRRAAGRD